eukprot:3447363-Prymnesium_polylepis.1
MVAFIADIADAQCCPVVGTRRRVLFSTWSKVRVSNAGSSFSTWPMAYDAPGGGDCRYARPAVPLARDTCG